MKRLIPVGGFRSGGPRMPQVGSFPIRGIVIGFESLTFLLRASVHFCGYWQVWAHPFFWSGPVYLWEVLLRLSINFLLFWGFHLGCSSCNVSKDHRDYRLASQLAASPLPSVAEIQCDFSFVTQLFWRFQEGEEHSEFTPTEEIRPISLLKQTSYPQAKNRYISGSWCCDLLP